MPAKKIYRKKRLFKKRTMALKPKPALRKMVKKIMHQQIENKCVQVSAQNQIVSTFAYGSFLTVSMVPYGSIAQGTGQGDRIGNTIRPRSVYFNYVLNPIPYANPNNLTPVPQDVMIFFGKVKNSKPQIPISTDYTKLWQQGDSYRGPYSTNLDLIQQVNTDWFTVVKIVKHKIGFANNQGLGSNVNQQYFANNDYKLNVIRKLNITKYIPKVVKFNDTTSQPTNDGLFMWATSVNCDGTANSTNAPVYMSYCINFTWEDA